MKKTIKIISIVLAAAIVIGVAAVAINRLTPSKAEETTSAKQTTTVPQTEEITVDWNGEEFKAVNNDGLINILLVGQDRRPNEGRQRSDAMILCSFNPETNKMSMISFLRDLYVQIPGHQDNRLNAAYVYGGFDLLKETLNLNFGITVDGCFEADFEGFEKIIDIAGGVDIELTAEEAKIVGGGATEGVCHLSGEQALTYARIRKIDSDFQRTARQRNIMNAVFTNMKNRSLTELALCFTEILPLMATDMTDDEIMSLAMTYASSFSALETASYSVPAKGAYKDETIRGMAVKVPDLYENKKLIFEEYLPLS